MFSEAAFPLYFEPNISFRLKGEIAFAACNTLLNCKFEDAYTLLSSGPFLRIIVDALKLQNKDKEGSLSMVALDGTKNLFNLCEKQNRGREALDMPEDIRVEQIFTEFETLGGVDALEAL